MNKNKFLMKMLMAGMLLTVLFTAACGVEPLMVDGIKGPAEEALVERGDEIMTVFKEGDFQAIHNVLSPEAGQALDKATYLVSGLVDLESIIMQIGPVITSWRFDRARIFTKGGAIRGKLEGRVDYDYGKPGKLSMELEQMDGTWKLRNINFNQ